MFGSLCSARDRCTCFLEPMILPLWSGSRARHLPRQCIFVEVNVRRMIFCDDICDISTPQVVHDFNGCSWISQNQLWEKMTANKATATYDKNSGPAVGYRKGRPRKSCFYVKERLRFVDDPWFLIPPNVQFSWKKTSRGAHIHCLDTVSSLHQTKEHTHRTQQTSEKQFQQPCAVFWWPLLSCSLTKSGRVNDLVIDVNRLWHHSGTSRRKIARVLSSRPSQPGYGYALICLFALNIARASDWYQQDISVNPWANLILQTLLQTGPRSFPENQAKKGQTCSFWENKFNCTGRETVLGEKFGELLRKLAGTALGPL